MNIIKRAFGRCENRGCWKEAVARLSAVTGTAGDIMTLYSERKYCMRCGLKKIIEFGNDRSIAFDIDEEFKTIIDSDENE